MRSLSEGRGPFSRFRSPTLASSSDGPLAFFFCVSGSASRLFFPFSMAHLVALPYMVTGATARMPSTDWSAASQSSPFPVAYKELVAIDSRARYTKLIPLDVMPPFRPRKQETYSLRAHHPSWSARCWIFFSP